MTINETIGAALASAFVQERFGPGADLSEMNEEAIMHRGFMQSPQCGDILRRFGHIALTSSSPPDIMMALFMSLVIFAYRFGYGHGQAETMRDALHITDNGDRV